MKDIIKDFCIAWQTLNAELIIKHLDDSFVYDSQWVFASLDYSAYKDYIRGKFEILKNKGILVEASIVEDPYWGGPLLMLKQNGQSCYYRIKVMNDKVIKGDLCVF
jgi:hypothetical protein